MLLADHLGDVAEVVGHFVDQARRAGASWSDIGRSMGVTKQTIGVAHLVVALVADPGSTAARAIEAQGVSLDDVRRTAGATLPGAADPAPELVPFDAHGRRALELTFREAMRLDAATIGTGHLLLALLDVEDGTGVLAGLGVDRAVAEAFVRDSSREG